MRTALPSWGIGLICCLAGLLPGGAHARPDMARATASVAARVLAPVSLAVSYDTARAFRPARLMVSLPGNQVFHLHINSTSHHSYEQNHIANEYPLQTTSTTRKSAKTDLKKHTVTLYFN